MPKLLVRIAAAALMVARGLAAAPATPGEPTIFSCDFTREPAREWNWVGGIWGVKDGCLTQTDPGPADPKKALLVLGSTEELSTDLVVTAKLRIDSCAGGDSRVGITVCSDPKTGRGYNLVFHQGKLQFMQDYVAWEEGIDFHYEIGKWYWLKLRKEAGEIQGKAWPDGEPEPAGWLLAWSVEEDLVGYPGLNGGALGGPALLSFARFRVERTTRAATSRGLEGSVIDLNGTWQVRPESKTCLGEAGLVQVREAQDGWMPAQVPGEIHLDLMKAGKMPEPTVSLNMPKCRWPETNSWWYRTTFTVPADFHRYERQRLVFDGLDLNAQVFVNGKLAGEAADAFVPAAFEVKKLLQAGRNELVVRLTDGSELAPATTGPPVFMWGARTWLRKPQFSWGWDWVDGLPNISIWRGVRLEGRRRAVLHDLRLDTVRLDGRVGVEMEAVVENLSATRVRDCALELEIHPPEGGAPLRRRYPVEVPPGRMPLRDLIEIPGAKLWWPNGIGYQPLYRIVARVSDIAGSVVYDQRELSLGLRTIEVDRRRLAQGTRFCFRVNGQDVFCRGGNLGPQDPILARVSDAKYQALVAEAKNAHFTMFRLNGVAEFEGPAFYEACDRAGILLWHDFMFACAPCPEDNQPFMTAVRAEITSAILLYRHHPSIALWSGNNECYGDSWKLFQQVVPDLCRELDPRRPYWPTSPAGGDLAGDTHAWYCSFMTPGEILPEFRVRFVSEYGVLGPCHLDSIREYLGTEEMTRGDANWRFHTQDRERANEYVSKGIRLNHADPDQLTVSEWVQYGQMWQALIQGGMMEALRFQKDEAQNDCQGALIWSYTACMGQTGWAIWDYYTRRKAAYYWFRRAAAPVKVIVRERGGQLLTRVVNDTLEPVTGSVELGWWRLDGRGKKLESRPLLLAPNGVAEVAAVKLPPAGERAADEWLYAAVLRGQDGRPRDQSVCLRGPFRKLKLANPQIQVAQLADGGLEISSPVFAHAVHTEDHGHELISDNWFDLLPGVPVHVCGPAGAKPESIPFEAVRPK
jgi:beta-mannosidase